jgi:membrane-associated phospholipid phosphatase
LIASSALIDSLGFFLLARSVFSSSIRPFLGLMILLGLRQILQRLCALPPPEGMIWRYPGFPSLLVTYGVSNDLFFSGHTAVAVFGAVELGRIGWRWLTSIAVAVAVFEVATVLVLRAHYTMDVFTGAVTAMLVAVFVAYVAPTCDQALGRAFAHFRAR